MQLFPDTHPATLHTVLTLCKNDFFCAVDKLLYAKRCKALYNRSQVMLKKHPVNRSHPYCNPNEHCKYCSQNEGNLKKETKQVIVQSGETSTAVKNETVTEKQEKKGTQGIPEKYPSVTVANDGKEINLSLNSMTTLQKFKTSNMSKY